eukprot:TRINITY_DN5256_c0_g1_i1.p1 TRINITY_DN5256_c0_g1~~TRINITY_DN5256_c0_g1_i1.p1  ORF type:complete len:383 (+),score=122.62 TRINITY_DN5256_c0_g1_i1:57-1151(+)
MPLQKVPTGEEYQYLVDMAKMASLAYPFPSQGIAKLGLGLAFEGLPPGFMHQDYDVSKRYKKIKTYNNRLIDTSKHPFDATLWEGIAEDTKNLWVLAICGTEPNSFWDIRDFLVMNDGLSVQMGELLQIVKPLKEEARANKKDLVFTGHSQGGSLADVGAMVTNCRAVAFNGGGISPDVLKEAKLSDEVVAQRKKNLIHVNVAGDWISDPHFNAPNTGGNTRLGFPFKGVPIPFLPAPMQLPGPAIQHGDTFYWLQTVEANFLGPVPDCLALSKFAKAVLNHSWDSFHYQLTHRNFLEQAETPKKPFGGILYIFQLIWFVIQMYFRFLIVLALWVVRLWITILLFFTSILSRVEDKLELWYYNM